MALEYAKDKIRINAIAPTVIVTEPIQKLIDTDPDMAKTLITNSNPMLGPGEKIIEIKKSILDDEYPQVSDVAGVVAFLCGPESKFINGAIIPIDGGYSCN